MLPNTDKSFIDFFPSLPRVGVKEEGRGSARVRVEGLLIEESGCPGRENAKSLPPPWEHIGPSESPLFCSLDGPTPAKAPECLLANRDNRPHPEEEMNR